MYLDVGGKVALVITTSELDSDTGLYDPTLIHVCLGDTLDEAFETAKSHLYTDYFFSSSFRGWMRWKDNTITLSNAAAVSSEEMRGMTSQMMLQELYTLAQSVVSAQERLGLDRVIKVVTEQVPRT